MPLASKSPQEIKIYTINNPSGSTHNNIPYQWDFSCQIWAEVFDQSFAKLFLRRSGTIKPFNPTIPLLPAGQNYFKQLATSRFLSFWLAPYFMSIFYFPQN